MNIVTHLQELDDLIVEHTKPPVTSMLRNKVAFCIEQASARAADVERQEQTLATQIKTIEGLVKENQDLVATIANMKSKTKRELDDWFAENAKKQAEFRKRHTLDHNA